jgi:hypothetical protein
MHVNLWRRRIKRRSNKEESFIDIGFRFRDASSIAAFQLFVPFRVDQSGIRDLGHILHDRGTLMAVFNEAYVAGGIDNLGTYAIHDADDKEVLSCHSLRPGIDFTAAIVTAAAMTAQSYTSPKLCVRDSRETSINTYGSAYCSARRWIGISAN